VLGGASNFDPFGVTAANPDGGTVASVQLAALADAGLAPRDVRAIKTHGTSSPLNDAGEAAGIRSAFGTPPPLCGLKAYVGHTLGACGALELALFGAALHRGFVPATAGFEEFDPELGVRPTTSALAAERGAYLLDYFGFGGSNAALVMGAS
jgi:3-oxoacyl-[acyl-carrier-protein] synthase-1